MEPTRQPGVPSADVIAAVFSRRVALDAAGRLDFDLHCVECGYNLRGLLPAGVCGECGSTVELSFGRGPLAGLPQKWTHHVRWGIGTLTVLLPWLWLPLAWPLAWAACWRATESDPVPGRRGEWPALVARIVLMGLPVVVGIWVGLAVTETWPWTLLPFHLPFCLGVAVAFLLCATLAGARLSVRVAAKVERRALGLSLWAWVLAPPAIAMFEAGDLLPKGYAPLADTIPLLGVLAMLGVLVVLPIALVRVWRQLEAAEAMAGGGRSRISAWVANSATSSAATPPAAGAARPPARA